MSQPQAEQLALDGLAPRRRRPSRKREPQQAQSQPIARVVLDVQAPHLGQTFDYLVASKDSDTAQAGALVRVRFGGQRVNGIIWERAQSSDLPSSSLKYIERVLVPQELISASMRRDISAIAQAYGGTRANILRLALPPRVARVDREQAAVQAVPAASNPAWQRAGQAIAEQMEAELQQDYQHIESLSQAFSSDAFTSVCIDALPGLEERERLLAWSVVQSLLNARSAVVVLPDARHMASLARALTALGLRPFAPDPDPDHEGGWAGDFVLLGSSLPPAERYRSYRALASGQVSCVLGLRAAMYAPVEGPALFAILDDAAYQNADGMTPYANARGVLRLRAKLHQGIFVSLGHARSARSQWECSPDAQEVSSGVTGPAQSVVPAAPALSDRLPWVRWFNRQELARLADPAIGARVPHVAVSVLNQALQSGPVLLLIPQDGVEQTLSCAHCHRQARCPKCTGPLRLGAPGHAPRCAWCGSAAVGWACPSCSCEQMRLVRVGAAGTAQELRLLFRGVPITISTPSSPGALWSRSMPAHAWSLLPLVRSRA
ncbi:hypothetical protein KIM372_06410 [Bombiscardovia nodaiensis]|uniref:Primosomal protein N' 3' DNA-binding domain-containing protein n=1 Tax=Bombiscardovia nodaiensis TaxID=2932181 RepID=A0ABN6SB93_9BIFI|nr:hypothetical protein KIM372_06410 [Bombiscardovia nodaiensis]